MNTINQTYQKIVQIKEKAVRFLTKYPRKKKRTALLAAPFLIMILLITAKLVGANGTSSETPNAANAGSSVVNPAIRPMQWPAYEGVKPEVISITKNTSQILRFDRPIARTAISNPGICDISPIGSQDVLVNAKEAGNANLIVWDNANNVAAFGLESTLDLEKLNTIFQSIDPKSNLKLVPFNNTVAVYGTAETSTKLKEVGEAAKAFDKDAISFAELKESKQILLEVRFAEINRKNNKDFKLDAEALSKYFAAGNFTGRSGWSSGKGNSNSSNSSSFTPEGGAVTFKNLPGLPNEDQTNLFGLFVNKKTLATGVLDWLEQQNILKIIARPNLLAKDGEEASFIVGGEFPVPLSTQDRITIEYKEFGTKMKFTPAVLDDGAIRLKVETEVSELDFSNTVSFGGITVPSIIKRNHQTVAELKDNQTLVIGGLLTQKIQRIKRKVPFFGDIPFLGLLFAADVFERNDVELLVVITPHFVKPFELNEHKVLYDPAAVKDATRPYSPASPDAQGDTINEMITQDEGGLFNFNKMMKRSNKDLVQEMIQPQPQKKEEPKAVS